MVDSTSQNMALRTIYLPLEIDRELKALAFTLGISKAELMRGFILQGLRDMKEHGEPSLAERVTARVVAHEAADAGRSLTDGTHHEAA